MKKSITLSLVLATSLGLAACGEKAADEAAPAAEDTATVEGAADGAMEAAEGAADATAAAADATANHPQGRISWISGNIRRRCLLGWFGGSARLFTSPVFITGLPPPS